jgi:hypothetical protein
VFCSDRSTSISILVFLKAKYLSAEEMLVSCCHSSAAGALAKSLAAISAKTFYGCFLSILSEERRYSEFFSGSLAVQKLRALFSRAAGILKAACVSSKACGMVSSANRAVGAVGWKKAVNESFFLGWLYRV